MNAMLKPAQASNTEKPMPEAIAQLDQAHSQAMMMYRDLLMEAYAINKMLASATGCAYERVEIGRLDIDCMKNEVAASAGRVARVAKEALSTPTAPCTVTGKDLYRPHAEKWSSRTMELTPAAVESAYAEWLAVKPSKLWAEALALHDPAESQKEAAHDAARTLVYGFRLARANEIKTVKGKIELTIEVYTEKDFKGRQTFRDVSRLTEFAAALAVFTGNAAPDAAWFPRAFMRLVEAFAWGKREVISREHFDLGDGVELVTFNSSFRFRLPQSIAQALNAFVIEYAPEMFEEGAERW